MALLRPFFLTLGLLVVAAFAPATAAAAPSDPTGFHLTSSALFVDSSAGQAVVTIERTDTSREAQIRYLTAPGSAIRGEDYTPVKSMIDFIPGQSSATFKISIVNRPMPGPSRTIQVALFGPSPIGLASPSSATLTILYPAVATIARDPLNPLALPATPPINNPLTGARPFVDYRYGLANVELRQLAAKHPSEAGMLKVIADQPEVHRFGNWTGPNPGMAVSQYLSRASDEAPGTVPEFATYYIVDAGLVSGHCHKYSDPPWRVGAYHKWIQSLAQGVGSYRAIMFLEMDSLITVGCLSHHGLQVRLQELHDAVNILSKVPHLVVYMDAGAADAIPAPQEASMLRAAGVKEIQGFFLNSTHFDWTSKEIRYGNQLSRMTGGRHFVVNTAENGAGPLIPHNRVKNGNEVLCNPPNRGLGPKPTFSTGFRNVDAFAWIANPGKSGGECRPGAPKTGIFWPKLALELVRHANFRVR
jgi:endoglucanase